MNIFDWHKKFEGSVEWKMTTNGLLVRNPNPVTNGSMDLAFYERTRGEPVTVSRIWHNYSDIIEKWSREYLVPADLIVAIIAGEDSKAYYDIRQEPGFVSDEKTPNKVSAGIMQTLLSTAKESLLKRGVTGGTVTRKWLFVPENSIQAGVSYMDDQRKKSLFDPILVAASYNAGGVYANSSTQNRFRIKCYPIGTSRYLDRFVMYLNDFYALMNSGEIIPPSLTLMYKKEKT